MIKSNFLVTLQKKIDKLDIRTLKEHLNNLILDNELLTNVFNSMSEGVIVLNNNYEIIFLNKIAEKILEINKENCSGFQFDKIIKNSNFNTTILNLLKKNDKVFDFELKIDSPYAKFISISIQPLVQHNKIIGNIITINDISIEKEREKKIKQIEGLAALTTISAGIAHEIKNPLGSMSIHIQLIEQEIEKCECLKAGELRYSIDIIKEEIDRLSEIVNNFLYTVKPIKTDLMLTNLTTFLDKFVDFILPELAVNGIELKKNYSNLPDVWLDEKYFKQGLLNIIKNSIASLNDSDNKEKIIEIEAYCEKNFVFINIIDNGPGIPEEIQTKIFDPYFTTKSNGTGLGLTILYKIIKEHNGDLSFSSKKGETIFTIRLPSPYLEKGLIDYKENIPQIK